MYSNHQKISVIIPIFNEPRILKSLKIIAQQLQKDFADFEIICVDDGSKDGTLTKLKRCHIPKVKILTYKKNKGKGFALRHGFSHSHYDLVAFIDSDLDLHPKQLRLFADLMTVVNCEIVVGSKRHPLSQVNYPPLRRFYSRIFQLIIRILFGLKVADTQVGIKLFKRKVLTRVLPHLVVKAWAFDLELLVVAYHLGFRRIIEAPIELRLRKMGSKIDATAVGRVIQDTAAIFYRRYLLHYYDRKITAETL